MKLSFIVRGPEKFLKHQATLPGPIWISETTDGEYRINYPHVSNLNLDSISALRAPLIGSLDLSVEPDKETQLECDSAVDLTRILDFVFKLAGSAEAWGQRFNLQSN